jgi:hydroxymethylglutaryl-CoA lyase
LAELPKRKPRAKVAGWLSGEALHGTLWRAGLPKTLAPAQPFAA